MAEVSSDMQRMPDSFEIAKTLGKSFFLLCFLIPVGIAVAAFVVNLL